MSLMQKVFLKEFLKFLTESVVWAQLKLFRVESNSLCALRVLWDHISEGDALCGCQHSADTELLLHAVPPWAFSLAPLPLPPWWWVCFRMSPECGWILEVRGKGIRAACGCYRERAVRDVKHHPDVQPPRASALPELSISLVCADWTARNVPSKSFSS